MALKIKVLRRKKPVTTGVDDEIHWFCSSLGFCETIDRDETAMNIFKNLLASTYRGTPVKSDELSESVGKSRGAIVNHLNKLISAGLIVRRNNRYELREQNLENTIREMHKDMDRIFEDLERTAKEIDEKLKGF